MNHINLTNDGTSEISFLHDFYDEISDCILDFGISLDAFTKPSPRSVLRRILDVTGRLDIILFK